MDSIYDSSKAELRLHAAQLVERIDVPSRVRKDVERTETFCGSCCLDVDDSSSASEDTMERDYFAETDITQCDTSIAQPLESRGFGAAKSLAQSLDISLSESKKRGNSQANMHAIYQGTSPSTAVQGRHQLALRSLTSPVETNPSKMEDEILRNSHQAGP